MNNTLDVPVLSFFSSLLKRMSATENNIINPAPIESLADVSRPLKNPMKSTLGSINENIKATPYTIAKSMNSSKNNRMKLS